MVYEPIVGGSIAETHERLESVLMKEGNRFKSQRNEVIELLNVHSIITMPYLRGHHSYWYGLKLDDYVDQWFKINDQGFAYTYGDRIIAFPKWYGIYDTDKLNGVPVRVDVENKPFNQLNFVINELKQYPNSRRAMMVIYNPAVDSGKEDVPCLQTLQFQLRNRTLITTVQYRSHDIDAYYPNLCGISELAKYISMKIAPMIMLGEIHVYSNNLHKYITEL